MFFLKFNEFLCSVKLHEIKLNVWKNVVEFTHLNLAYIIHLKLSSKENGKKNSPEIAVRNLKWFYVVQESRNVEIIIIILWIDICNSIFKNVHKISVVEFLHIRPIVHFLWVLQHSVHLTIWNARGYVCEQFCLLSNFEHLRIMSWNLNNIF